MVAALVGEDILRVSYPKQEGLRRSRRLIHRLADAFFGESSKDLSIRAFVCHGSRLFGGKTVLQGLLACTRMIPLGAECYILGGSKDQTAVMRRYLFQTSLRTKGVWGGIGRGLRAC